MSHLCRFMCAWEALQGTVLAAAEQRALTQASWAGYLHLPGDRLLPLLIAVLAGCHLPLCSAVLRCSPCHGSNGLHIRDALPCCVSAKHMSGLLPAILVCISSYMALCVAPSR